MAQYTKSQLVSASNATYFTNTSGGISASAVRDLNDSWISSSALLSGSNTFIGNQIISGSLTAQLQANYIWLGGSNGYNQAVSTSSISLQGAQGIQGLQGTIGSQGVQGITGAQGITGSQGIQGTQGLTGAQGLQGITGTQGIQGITGASGSQGIQGIQGADNSTQGAQGTTGLQGIQGINGISGSNGAQGTQGIQGIQGADNSTQGIQGIQGIQGADNSTQGAQGTQGTNGTQGVQGFTGAQGIQGIQGITGITGSNGTQGAQGIQGVQGTQGSGVSSGSLLVTASFASTNITFTKGDATTFNLPGFATTGSNTFTGNQVITGSLYVSSSIQKDVIVEGQLWISSSNLFASGSTIQPQLNIAGATSGNVYGSRSGSTLIRPAGLVLTRGNTYSELLAGGLSTNGPDLINTLFSSNTAEYTLIATDNNTIDNEIDLYVDLSGSYFRDYDAQIGYSSWLTLGPNDGITIPTPTFTRGLKVTGSLDISGSLTASLQQGFTYVGNANGRTVLVATSSFGGTTNTGSLLVTGSVAGNVLTFTKGDATTFNLTVATGSGGGGTGSVDTGSLLVTASFASNNITFTKGDASQFSLQGFATTGSNTFNGTQNISGSIVMNSANDGEKFLIYRNGQPTQNWEFGITSPGNSFLKTRNRTWVQNDGVDGELMIHYLPTKFENGIYTQGSQLSITGSVVIAGNLTASLQQGYAWVGNSGGVSSLVATSSFGTSINTGSFATTGSNIFIGTQIITGSMFVYDSGSGQRAEIMNGQISRFPQLYATTLFPGTIQDDNGNNILIKSNAGGATNGGFLVVNTVSGSQFTGSVAVQGNIDITGQYLINGVPISGGANIDTGSLMRTGSVAGNVLTFTKGDATTFSLTVATGSGGGSTDTGSLLVTASFNTTTRDITFTKGDASTFKLGAFAITGSNTFNANQTITTAGNTQLDIISTGGGQANLSFQAPNSNFAAYGQFNITNNGQYGGSGSIKVIASKNSMELAADSGIKVGATNGGGNAVDAGAITMQVRSGSLSLAPAGTANTTASLLHLSSSSNTANVNLIFKNNSNTADTIISGSNNIFTNPTAATAGLKRFIGGSGNLMLSPGAVNQISASQAFPITTNFNIHTGGSISTRAAVSASAWTISNNMLIGSIQVGNATANAEKLLGTLNITSNQVQNTLVITANRTAISASTSINSNAIIGGSTVLTMASSSIGYFGNVGNATITNGFQNAGGSSGNNALSVSQNWFGAAIINVSGSDAGGLTNPRSISNNYLFSGYQTTATETIANLSLNGSGSSMVSTMAMGHELGITGSNGLDTNIGGLTPGIGAGSAFFGRWNSQSGNRARTAETIFAIGTGTSTSLTKTGFLIDSGSNSYFEGTLNVSGSTTMTGSLTVTGSTILKSLSTTGTPLTIQSSNTTDYIAAKLVGGGLYISSSDYGTSFVGGTDLLGTFNLSGTGLNMSDDNNNQYASITKTGIEVGWNNTGNTNLWMNDGSYLTNVTVASPSGSGTFIAGLNTAEDLVGLVQFQSKANWTDGRTTFLTPLVAKSGSIITGSFNVSGSSTFNGNQTISGSLLVSSFTTLASVSSSLNFADDTAAAAGGVPLGGLYRNGNFVMIRLT